MTTENLSGQGSESAVGSTTQATQNMGAQSTSAQSSGTSGVENTQIASGEGQGEIGSQEQQAQQQQPAYTPNYKFKVMKKDMEIEELFRGVIKDADSEKKVRELHERAYGLDVVKDHLKREMETRKTLEADYQQLSHNVGKLVKFRDSGDLDSFFQGAGLKEEQVFQWVQRRLNEMGLPPEQRAEAENARKLRQRQYELEEQNQTLQSQQFETSVSQRIRDVEMALAEPEIQSIAQSYDAAMGKDGAFIDLIGERGSLAWHQRKVDIPVEQAVQEAVAIVSKLLKSQGNTTQQQTTPMPGNGASGMQQQQVPPAQGVVQKTQTQAPTIPNMGSRATSPVKKQPESIDDLKKLAKAQSGV